MAAAADASSHDLHCQRPSGLTITRRLTLMVGMAAVMIVMMLVVSAQSMRSSIHEDRKAALRN
jgi:DMSO/TMAO reductase YedYZ heme-binding membrane subunit